MKRFVLLDVAVAFLLFANLPAVDAQEACLLPLDRKISDTEISGLFFRQNDPTSCGGKRDACERAFDSCLSSLGANEADREFLRVERREVCDRKISRMCRNRVSPPKPSRITPVITSVPTEILLDGTVLGQQAGSSGAGPPLTLFTPIATPTTLLSTASGADPTPSAITITFVDENGDSIIDLNDLDITLQEQQKGGNNNDKNDNKDNKDNDKNNQTQTIAKFREKFKIYCSKFSNGGGPESCSWSSPQFVGYYNGNWTQFCSKETRDTFGENDWKPPSAKGCKQCDPEEGINSRDSVCLGLLFFTWPAEFKTMVGTLPTSTKGLNFPQRALADESGGGNVVQESLYHGVGIMVWCLCWLFV